MPCSLRSTRCGPVLAGAISGPGRLTGMPRRISGRGDCRLQPAGCRSRRAEPAHSPSPPRKSSVTTPSTRLRTSTSSRPRPTASGGSRLRRLRRRRNARPGTGRLQPSTSTCTNDSTALTHSCAIVDSSSGVALPLDGGTVAFAGASVPNATDGLAYGLTDRFSFVASKVGLYRIDCLVIGHEADGMWDCSRSSSRAGESRR